MKNKNHNKIITVAIIAILAIGLAGVHPARAGFFTDTVEGLKALFDMFNPANLVQYIPNLFDTISSFFVGFLPNNQYSTYSTEFTSALNNIVPYLVSFDKIFPVFTFFGILSMVIFIEMIYFSFRFVNYIAGYIRGGK